MIETSSGNVIPPGAEARLNAGISRYYTRYYRDILALPGWQERVAGRLTEERVGSRQTSSIERVVGPFAGRRLLNVGCGTGGFNVAAEKAGARTCGIDASEEAVAICGLRSALQTSGRYAVAEAEGLPFRDASFDLVTCLSTLEHVSDVGRSLTEMLRVLSPGGALFVYAPSGWTLYESHYKIAWLPWFPRALARMYLRVRGRPTGFVDTLNALSARRCRRILEAGGARVEVLDGGVGEMMGGLLVRAYYRTLRVKPYIALLARKPAS